MLAVAAAGVDEVGVTGLHADEHEASAADVAGLGEDDGEREADRDGRVHGIAAGLQDLDAGVGGVVVDADHHRVFGGGGRRADDGVGVGHVGSRCCLGRCRCARQSQDKTTCGDSRAGTHADPPKGEDERLLPEYLVYLDTVLPDARYCPAGR
jgi:hypothetical protein